MNVLKVFTSLSADRKQLIIKDSEECKNERSNKME